MATITPTDVTPRTTDHIRMYQWTPLTFSGSDVGSPIELSGYADRSVQVEGTFGGATLPIEGSNDGVNYRTLKDHLGNNLTFSSGDIKAIDQIVRHLRPGVPTGGDGTTSLTVTTLLRAVA